MGAESKNSTALGESTQIGQRVQELDAVAQEGDLPFFPGLEVVALLAQHVEGKLNFAWRFE
eukprot:11369268-Heterocapsa_arctica.AAC.1